MPVLPKSLARPLWVALGFTAFGLGTAGIFLPLVPTTPLYLLAAFCFARGSARFHRWLTSTTLYKRRLEGFVETRSMTLKAKLIICVPVAALVAVIGWLTPSWPVRGLLAAVLLAKWWCFAFCIGTTPRAPTAGRRRRGGSNYERGCEKVGGRTPGIPASPAAPEFERTPS
ncbi:MAG: YbaN family protein [Bifidobacteriaceae bacterium]|jgi:uncharacterized membrane protein YbaN (DUF454 family)|nr:YbaN family protein [Bifidobacteriaceae bacterium]